MGDSISVGQHCASRCCGKETPHMEAEPLSAEGCSDCSDMASPERRNYCRDCGWSATTAEYGTQELGRRAIGHTIETGHDIDSEIILE